MRRPLRVELPVEDEPAAVRRGLVTDPQQWLPPPARRRGPRTWTVTLVAGPVARSVACQVGPPWEIGDTIWRSLSWVPEPEVGDLVPLDQLLPEFDGHVGLRTDADGRGVLLVEGFYTPPGGVLGAALDLVALHRVAGATGRRLVEELAARSRITVT